MPDDRPQSAPQPADPSAQHATGVARPVLVESVSPAVFDAVYRSAGGDPAGVPWSSEAHGTPGPHPLLCDWLSTHGCQHVRTGARAIVVASSLGDDVAALIDRGFDAVGFDLSAEAVAWSARRFPEHAPAFFQADLRDMPTKHRGRYDLVVEIDTLLAVDEASRPAAAAGLTTLCSPRGCVLVIIDAAFGVHALTDLLTAAGLTLAGDPEHVPDPRPGGTPRLRCVCHRAG